MPLISTSLRAAIAATLAVTISGLPGARAAPSDPLAMSLPARDSKPPEATRTDGTSRVVDTMGSVSYEHRLDLPMGRRGMQPALALRYASEGALRGGVAVGWSLDVPVIERDPDFPAEVRWRSTLGGEQRLIANTVDPGPGLRYRAEVDGGFTRYEHDLGTATWVARTLDGVRHEFGLAYMGRAYLTKQVDAFGNTVVYNYTPWSANGYHEQQLASIEYTSNPGTSLVAHAKVDLLYTPGASCGAIPVGAAVEHAFGYQRLRGGRQLTNVRVSVRETPSSSWRIARDTALTYDTAELGCGASALRWLSRIDTTAYSPQGVATAAPPVVLGYGAKQRTLTRTVQWPSAPREGGGHRGATSGFLDVNGDGRADAVRVLKQADGCHLEWRAGGPDGAFAITPQTFKLPSARWRDDGDPDPSLESCTLSGQVALRPLQGNAQHCWDRAVYVSYLFVDWDGDGATDVLSWLSGNWNLAGEDFTFNDIATLQDNGGIPDTCPGGTHEVGQLEEGGLICACNNASAAFDSHLGQCRPACGTDQSYDMATEQCTATPSGGGGGGPTTPQCGRPSTAPQRVGGEYVWFVQRHTGGGTFAPLGPETRVYSPRALPPIGAAEISVETPGMPDLPTLVDFDGDGHLDVISLGETDGGDPIVGSSLGIHVWRGNGSAYFGPRVLWAFRGTWAQAPQPTPHTTEGALKIVTAKRSLALRDVNGDGAPDLIVQQGPNGRLAVVYNQPGGWIPVANQTVVGTMSAPVELGTASHEVEIVRNELTSWISNFVIGVRGTERRIVDLDADGTLELIITGRNGSITTPALFLDRYRLHAGAASMPWSSVGAAWEPAIEARVGADGSQWRRDTDFVDLTGDGLPDAISYDATGTMTLHTDALGNASMRKLTSVDNGRGGGVRYEYAWSTDPTVVATGTEALAPRAVVTRTIEVAGFGQPDRRVRYQYGAPVVGKHGLADPRPESFLGFASVTIESSGQPGDAAQRIERAYTYHPIGSDTAARLTSELTSIDTGAGHAPLRYETVQYAGAYLAGSTASATYVSERVQRTCAPGAVTLTCMAQAPTLTTTESWSAWASGGATALLRHTRTRTDDGVGVDRYVDRGHEVRWTATDARVLENLEERGAVNEIPLGGGQFLHIAVPAARTTTVYNTAGLPTEVRVSKDASTHVTTRRTFHPSGVELSEVAPNEVAGGAWQADFTYYDAFVLYPISHVNQLNQATFVTHDVATGVRLLRRGPNYRQTSPGVYVDDTEAWTIDGFGRVLTRADSLEPAAGVAGYDYRVVETTQYFDGELPNRRVVSRLRDVAANAWVIDEARSDGAGRALEHVERRQLGGQPDRRTVYTYDAGGALARIDATSPLTGTPAGTLVSTTFVRDGAGRVTSLQRPDGYREDTVYRNLEAEVTEQSPIDGAGARTTLRQNAYGELVEVREHDNPDPGITATTSYGFDGAGRLVSMTDADGVATTMAYDWRGLRTSIARGTRTWTYAYDANGNLLEQTEPVPSGGSATNYKTATSYDRLNRPLVVTPAVRALSASRRTQLGVGPITFAYDGNSFVGRPHLITLPFGTIARIYEANGQVARETRSYTLNQGVSLSPSQWVERRYDALGTPVRVKWDDGTEWSYTHDHRGAVADVKWRHPGTATDVVLAHYDRQAAGQPTARTSALAAQRRDWQYDLLGRVVHDRVWSTSTAATFHERTYGFDGFGELRATVGLTNGMDAGSDLDYDAHHRVKHVDGPGAYDADFTYSKAGNVRTAAVTGALDAPNRNVDYVYGTVDPQAVDRITDRTTGATVASWGYDLTGNNTTRAVGAASRTFTWGGDGLLHETAGTGGTERYYFAPGAERVVALGPDGVKVWFGESETHFSNTGTFQRRYFHVGAGEPIARAERTTVSGTHAIELQYADALQNLAVTINAANAVTSAFVYGAFGEVVGSLGAATHRRGFNGKEHDAVSTLRHYGWRSYDPVSLRWASADPMYRVEPDRASERPQLANLYAFSLNNPVRFYDPDGREPTQPEDVDPDGELAIDDLHLPNADDFSWTRGMVGWITPDNNDGTGLVVAKALGAVVLALPIGAVSIYELNSYVKSIPLSGVKHVVRAVDRWLAPTQIAAPPTDMQVDEETSVEVQQTSNEAPIPSDWVSGPKVIEKPRPRNPNRPRPTAPEKPATCDEPWCLRPHFYPAPPGPHVDAQPAQ